MIIKISIPENSDCLIKKGEEIDFETPLFNKETFEEIKINLAENLGINPDKIFEYVKKLVGEKVKKDEILAVKNTFLYSVKIKSPADGVIKEINHNQGTIVIKKKSNEKSDFLSPVKGIIQEINDSFLKIKVNQGKTFLLKEKSEKNLGGEIYFFEKSFFFQIKREDVDKKIIIGESLSSFEQTKLEALGARAFITLESLPEKTSIDSFRLKNIDDIKKISKENFLYCTIIENSDNIYFYI